MKKIKKMLSLVLTVLLLLSSVPIMAMAENATKETVADCQVGDIIEFGSYPQSKVTDEETIAALNDLDCGCKL